MINILIVTVKVKVIYMVIATVIERTIATVIIRDLDRIVVKIIVTKKLRRIDTLIF